MIRRLGSLGLVKPLEDFKQGCNLGKFIFSRAYSGNRWKMIWGRSSEVFREVNSVGFSFLNYIGIRLDLALQTQSPKGQKSPVYLSGALCVVGAPPMGKTHPI